MSSYCFQSNASSEEELVSILKLVELKGFRVHLIDRNYNDRSDKPPAGEPYGFADSDYSFDGATFYVEPKNFCSYEGLLKAIDELFSQGINMYSIWD